MLSHKYRPKKFVDLIGQDVLVRTIKNSITLDRVANAFLLTGSHGIGKTTSARIIAMSLNCLNYDSEPCGDCTSCDEIIKACHPDVLEIDAASHTGVDDIREIIDNAFYSPVSAKYRVYIIDEVHMLSNSAFNALLKLLEEPPQHIKFIFATTEKKKVPLTVVSRCQSFTLQRLSADFLAQYLHDISLREEINLDRKASQLIANFANGSVRDALSLLDQVSSYSHEKDRIDAQILQDLLGMSDRIHLLEIIKNLFSGDINVALSLFNKLYNAGGDPVLILQNILELLYLMIRIKLNPQYQSVEYSENFMKEANSICSFLSLEFLNRVWQVLAKGLAELAVSSDYYMASEILLIRLSCLSDLPSPADAIKKIAEDAKITEKTENKIAEVLQKDSEQAQDKNVKKNPNVESCNDKENGNNVKNVASRDDVKKVTQLCDGDLDLELDAKVKEVSADLINTKQNYVNEKKNISMDSGVVATEGDAVRNRGVISEEKVHSKSAQYTKYTNDNQNAVTTKNIKKDIVKKSSATIFRDMTEVISHCKKNNKTILACYLNNSVELVKFEQCFIELRAYSAMAEKHIKDKLHKYLRDWTDSYWSVVVTLADNKTESGFDPKRFLNLDIMRNIMNIFNCSINDVNWVNKNGKN